MLTAGQISDKTAIPAVLKGLRPASDTVADRAYGASAILARIRRHGSRAHIPTQRDRKHRRSVDPPLHRQQNLVERFFNKPKQFRAIVTRYNKIARNFLAAIALVCAGLWWHRNESAT